MRRCIALDLLAHGDTEIAPDQDVSVTANARMIGEFLDAVKIDQVDLVGNDSGGGIAHIFAATNSGRVRSLTLVARDARGDADGQERLPLAAGPGAGLSRARAAAWSCKAPGSFFPEGRWAEFNRELRAHWQA